MVVGVVASFRLGVVVYAVASQERSASFHTVSEGLPIILKDLRCAVPHTAVHTKGLSVLRIKDHAVSARTSGRAEGRGAFGLFGYRGIDGVSEIVISAVRVRSLGFSLQRAESDLAFMIDSKASRLLRTKIHTFLIRGGRNL